MSELKNSLTIFSQFASVNNGKPLLNPNFDFKLMI